MKTYARYKDSGISWIGQIPEHWEVKRTKYVVDSFCKGNGITKDEVFDDGDVKCVRYGEIYSKYENSFSDCISKTKLEMITSPQFFSKGDILFAGTGELVEEIGKNIVYLGNEKCLAGGDIVIAKHSQNPIFLNYLLNSQSSQRQKSYGKAKLKVVHISAFEIGNVYVPLPPLLEQKAIADFLDEKTAKINELVAAKQKQIELLKEYKQSLIANAVTKGINPKAKMKDSCINWIGQIPEHWNVHYLFQKAKEHFISNKTVHHQNLLSLSYGKIVQKDINTTEGLLPESFDTYQIVEEGNIVLRLTDLQNDHKSLRVGFVTQEGIITSAYECLEVMSNSYFPKYLYYQLHSFDIKKMFYGMGGGLRQNLNYNELKKIRIAVPPVEEQKAIVEFIEKRVASIDSQILSIEKQIENLNEYKQSLISDVVTGKVKV